MTETVALLLALSAAATEPVPPPKPRALADAVLEFNRKAHFTLPVPGRAQAEKLVAGEVVRVFESSEDPLRPWRVVAMMLLPLPREAAYLARVDPHLDDVSDFAGARLSPPGANPASAYGYLPLPWPLEPRHWVVETTSNLALAKATGNRCWERWWGLAADGEAAGRKAVAEGKVPEVDSKMIASAIYTPVNQGAWNFIRITEGHTLLVYQVTSVVGGNIPDRAVAEFTLGRMRQLLTDVAGKAALVKGHYVGAHEVLNGADGLPIPVPAAP